jgi:hypothetical protein
MPFWFVYRNLTHDDDLRSFLIRMRTAAHSARLRSQPSSLTVTMMDLALAATRKATARERESLVVNISYRF